MLTLHHLRISQSERIPWLCEELGLPYNLVTHTRDPVLAPASLKNVPGNDTGKAPFLVDEDAGVTLSESGAICDYIIWKYGNGQLALKPNDARFADYLQWLHYANATLQANMLVSMFVGLANLAEDECVPPAHTMGPMPFAKARLDANFQQLDDRLRDNKWLAGEEFTAADIMNVYPLTTQRYFGPRVSLAAYPHLLRWLKDCSERPAFQRAFAKGDPEMKVLIDAEPPKVGMMESGGYYSDHWKK